MGSGHDADRSTARRIPDQRVGERQILPVAQIPDAHDAILSTLGSQAVEPERDPYADYYDFKRHALEEASAEAASKAEDIYICAIMGQQVAEQKLRILIDAASPFVRESTEDDGDEFTGIHMVATKGQLDALQSAIEIASTGSLPASPIRREGDWQDIATAPAFGGSPTQRILVIGGVYSSAEIVLADGDWWRKRKAEGGTTFTHWMPLPASPTALTSAPNASDGESGRG